MAANYKQGDSNKRNKSGSFLKGLFDRKTKVPISSTNWQSTTSQNGIRPTYQPGKKMPPVTTGPINHSQQYEE